MLRVALLVTVLVFLGAIAGAITGLLSVSLIWLGIVDGPNLARPFIIAVLAATGAIPGALLMPVFAWILRDRVPLWRLFLEPTAGAVLGANVAAWLLRSLETDVLMTGAFAGAVVAVVRLRLTREPGGAHSPLI